MKNNLKLEVLKEINEVFRENSIERIKEIQEEETTKRTKEKTKRTMIISLTILMISTILLTYTYLLLNHPFLIRFEMDNNMLEAIKTLNYTQLQ